MSIFKLILLLFSMIIISAVPKTINYQGKLLDSSAIGINDTLDITFRLYSSESGGESLWEDVSNDVVIFRGLFSVELTGFPESVDFSEQYYLEIQVGSEIFSPREKLSASPYSIRSEYTTRALQGVRSRDGVIARTGTLILAEMDGVTISEEGDSIFIFFGASGGSGTSSFNYSISINPTIDTVNAGFNVYPVIDLSIISGEAEQITLEITSGLPSGATASFSPDGCLPTCKSVMTVTTTSETPSGTYPIIITATSTSGLVKIMTYILTITPPFDYNIAIEPDNQTIDQGDSTSALITASLITGFSEDVAFSVSGLPSGTFASFNPTSCRLSCGSIMTIRTSTITPPGEYTVTISGMTSGGVVRTTTFSLTVNYFNYDISASPSEITIDQGQSTSSTINATKISFVTQPVDFELLPSPMYTGITANLSASSCSPDCNLTLNISATQTVTPGVYPIDIIATAIGGSERTITYTLTIDPFDFTLSLVPSSEYLLPTDSKTSETRTVLSSPVTQSVAFSYSTLPPNISWSFDPNSCEPGCTSIMDISSSSATPGIYSIDITATAVGGTERNQTFTLQICGIPSAPRNLEALPDAYKITLQWEAPDDSLCTTTISNYRIYRDISPNPTTLIQTVDDVLSYEDLGLSPSETFYYRITAVNSLGASVYSNEVSASPTYRQTCKQIKDAGEDSGNGLYWIDPNGGVSSDAFQVYCDMSTDGGGWTLVHSYNKSANTNPPVEPGVWPLNPSSSLTHVDSLVQYGFPRPNEVRLYCNTSMHSRVVHYKTTNSTVINSIYDNSAVAGCSALNSNVTNLSGHNANLPSACQDQTDSNNNQLFGYGFPMYRGGQYHWATSGSGNRWECDDFAGNYQYQTNHIIWVR